MEGAFDDAVRLLAQRVARPLRFEPAFRLLAPEPAVRPVVAVDGSHAVLRDTGAVWVVAVTAEAMRWPSPSPGGEVPEVVATTADEAEGVLEAAYAAAGIEAPAARTADAFAEALRGLRECQAAVAAARAMPPDGLLLVDGALQGLPPGPAAMAARIRDAAAPRLVAGIAKRSRLEADGHPLLAALLEAGERAFPRQSWSTPTWEVAGSFVCRFHGSAPFAYRVDTDREEALSAVAALCRDAAYPGYPYPLALVHNRVALTASRVADLRGALDAALRRAGSAVARAARDPHEMLDRNVTG